MNQLQDFIINASVTKLLKYKLMNVLNARQCFHTQSQDNSDKGKMSAMIVH